MRKEKHRTRYASSLSEEYVDIINDISKRTAIKKAQVLDKGLRLAFELYEQDRNQFIGLESAKSGVKKQYSTSLNKKDINRINDISEVTGVNKNKILEKALFLISTTYLEDRDRFYDL